MNLLKKNFTGALSLAGGCTVILDILQPIAPFAFYAAIASLLIIVVQVIFLKTNIIDFKNKNNIEKFLVFMVLIFVLSSGSFVTQKVIGATDKGVIASNVDVVRKLQKSILSVEDKINEVGESISSMKEELGKLKKETSDDPRKELGNLEIAWNDQGFSDVITQGDLHALQLFIDSKFNVYQSKKLPNPFLPNGMTISLLVDIFMEMPSDLVEPVFLLLKNNGIDLDRGFDHYFYSCIQSDNNTPVAIQREFSLLEVASICNDKEKIDGLINAGASVEYLKNRINNRINEIEKIILQEKCIEISNSKKTEDVHKKNECSMLKSENEAMKSISEHNF